MCGRSHGGHVVHRTRAVVHMGQHQHGYVAGQCISNLFSLHQLKREAALFAQAFSDVEVCWEVAAFTHHPFFCGVVLRGNRQRCGQHLEQVDRGAVGGHYFIGIGPNQRGNAIAQTLRQAEPTGCVPGADQTLAPFLGHHFGGTGRGGLGHHAQ